MDVAPWTCPECGAVWKAEPPLIEGTRSMTYDFSTDQEVFVERWVRAEDTP